MPSPRIQKSPTSRMPRPLAALAVALLSASGIAATLVQPAVAGAASSQTTIATTHNKTWGTILVLGNGTTVYRLAADPNPLMVRGVAQVLGNHRARTSSSRPRPAPPVSGQRGRR